MAKNCDRIIPGSPDCECVIKKNCCVFQKNKGGDCAGRTGGIGSDVEKGKKFVQQHQSRTWAQNAVEKVITPPNHNEGHHVFAHLRELPLLPQIKPT